MEYLPLAWLGRQLSRERQLSDQWKMIASDMGAAAKLGHVYANGMKNVIDWQESKP
jgi:hypothetical protein